MIVIKNTFKAKVWREICRFFRTFSLMSMLSQLAILVTLAGFLGGSIGPQAPLALYCLTALAILLMSHYSRKYFSEIHKTRLTNKAYEKIHRCSEKVRELNLLSTELYSAQKDQRPSLANEYLKKFIDKCDSVCCDIKESLNAIGYDIDAVCIKSIDFNKKTLHTVSRCTDRRKSNIERDKLEKIQENPFAKLLIETHANYDSHITHKELRKIRRNKLCKDMPKYLAVGPIDSKEMPSALVPILHGYAKTMRDDKETVVEIDPLMQSFRERAGGKYNACMGVMIAKKTTAVVKIGGSFSLEQSQGFVGLDSRNGNAWNFLDPNDVHLVAAIADSLYFPMKFYNDVKKRYC